MDHTIVIEGFKKAYGTVKPSWFEGDLIDGIAKTPLVGQEIDPLGGISKINPISFDLIDTSRDFAKSIKFNDLNSLRITGPSPLLYNDTDLTLGSTLHPTKKALRTPDSTAYSQFTNYSDFDFTANFTALFRFKPASFTNHGSIMRFADSAGNNEILLMIRTTGELFALLKKAGTSYYVFSVILLNLDELNTGGIRMNGSQLSVFINGSWVDKVGNAYMPNSGKTLPVMFNQNGGAYPANADFADGAIYGRALSDTETTAYFAGKDVNDTNLVWSMDGNNPISDQIIDLSGRNNHLNIPSGSEFISRDLVPGDLLYLPRDTARIVSASGTSVTVERGIFSCFEDGYKAYYHQDSTINYVCLAHVDNPQFWEGRLICYYQDDELKYVGYIVTIAQKGKSWKISTKSILEPIASGLKGYSYGMPLKHSDGTDWYVGRLHLDPGVTVNSTRELDNRVNAGLTFHELEGECTHSTTGIHWHVGQFSQDNGFNFLRSYDVEIVDNPLSRGTLATLFNNSDGSMVPSADPDFIYSHLIDNVKRYGVILGNGAKLSTESTNPESYVGQFLTVSPGAMVKIESYASGTGYFTLSGTYDDNLEINEQLSCGYSSHAPITLAMEPWVESYNLVELVYSILTSTGTHTNGTYDKFSGLFGLGLPESIVQGLTAEISYYDKIIVNLAEGKLVDDMQAMGIGLVFRDGKFDLKSMDVPIINLATQTVTTAMIRAGEHLNLNYGYYRPLKSIAYKGYQYKSGSTKIPYEITISVQNSNIFFGSTGREKVWNTQIRNLTTGEAFRIRILKLLQWFSNFAPTVNLDIPGHIIKMLDTINLEVTDMAGQGEAYTTENLPCLVIGKYDNHKLKCILNTALSDDQAAWVPSWEIESYASTTLTLRKSEGLQISDIVDLPAAMQIIRSDGTAIGDYTINSVVDADTVVLSAAPTYSDSMYKGILTLKDYTDVTNSDRTAKYVWSADSSGEMSDASTGKDFA